MTEGYFNARTTVYNEAMPIKNAKVYVRKNDGGSGEYNSEKDASPQNYDYYIISDSEGKTPIIALSAPNLENSFDKSLSDSAYDLYDVYIVAQGFIPILVRGIQIFPGLTSELPINLEPMVAEIADDFVLVLDVPQNAVTKSEEREREYGENQIVTDVLSELVIPSSIVVHLGDPDNPNAENLTVPFTEYIKNVASSEIFPTWDEQAIRANIIAQISLTLNRIYTEWYTGRGYPFQITNSTKYDQSFVKGRNIYDNISLMVDDIFNSFIKREGYYEPLFAQYCDGVRVNCRGMSQWGSQSLAEQGYDYVQILKEYYGDDIILTSTDNIGDIPESYPGRTLSLGDVGEDVLNMQIQLNRIRSDYPRIPVITRPNGRFNEETDAAVREFQRIFNLLADGIIGKATWYKISRIYVAVTRLGEITSEGTGTYIPREPPNEILKKGDSGDNVRLVQFILEYLSFFYPTIPVLEVDGYFGTATENSVLGFQKTFGLVPDGIVGSETWEYLYAISTEIQNNIAAVNENQEYPGTPLSVGSEGGEVEIMKKYYNRIASYYGNLPQVDDGNVFDEQFADAIRQFQQQYGLEADGVIGALTWTRIVELYNFIEDLSSRMNVMSYQRLPNMQYPGVPIKRGVRGRYVKYIQDALNTVYKHIGVKKYIGVSGEYGPETESSIIAYQKRRGLLADGVVGEETWNALFYEAESYNDGV